MLLGSFIMLFFATIMSDFGNVQVEDAILSPNSKYLAGIAVYDEGALGGSTVVNITRQKFKFNLHIGEFRPASKEIYYGRWSDHSALSLHWETDNILYVYLGDDLMIFERAGGNWTLVG
jgi:hypothetical protein